MASTLRKLCGMSTGYRSEDNRRYNPRRYNPDRDRGRRHAGDRGPQGRARGGLRELLETLDGAGYGSYRQLRGSAFPITGTSGVPGGVPRCEAPVLTVDHVQADPYAPPSALRIDVPLTFAGITGELLTTPVPVRDWLGRAVAGALTRHSPRGGRGSGSLHIDIPGPEILDRSSVTVVPGPDGEFLRVRMQAGLPAHGRRVNGTAAVELLCGVLPHVVHDALHDIDTGASSPLRRHVTCWRDQEYLRSQLPDLGLVGFLADGAVLPRAAGNSQEPLDGALPLTSPASLRTRMTLPSGRTVTGMGVPSGVTLIVGGGYHGKSTVLKALERGVYDHVPGDGRELCVTVADATTLRAEDGRSVTGTDISAFLRDLPSGTDTTFFSTTNASGSTSQAASLVEACEAGASCLLIDEDTSATNFMIRDARMRALVPADREPVTPLVDRVRPLFDDHGVSTVLVAGGSGAFIDVADTVIMLDAYRPVDVTDRAAELAGPVPAGAAFPLPGGRTPAAGPASTAAQGGNRDRGRRSRPPRARDLDTIQVGDDEIDLSACSQLVDASQTRAVAALLPLIAAEPGPLSSRARRVHDRITTDGWDRLPRVTGTLALPRVHEITAAVNRWRGLRIQRPGLSQATGSVDSPALRDPQQHHRHDPGHQSPESRADAEERRP